MRYRSILPSIAVIALAGALAAQPMAGTYTINRFLPAGGGNYTSLASAVADVMLRTVGGAVIFDIYDDDPVTGNPSPFTESSPTLYPAGCGVGFPPNTAVLVMGTFVGVSAVNTVTFRAAAGESPVLDATGKSNAVQWNGASYTTLEGLDMGNALFDGVNVYNEYGCVAGTGMNPAGVQNPRILRCRIHNCGGTAITFYGNGTASPNPVVRNNFIWSCQTSVANTTSAFYGNGRFSYIGSRREQNGIYEHNTIYADTGVGQHFAVIGSLRGAPSTPTASIRNNLIVKTAGNARPIYNWRDATQTGIPTSMDYNVYDDTSSPSQFMNHAFGQNYGTLGAFQAANPTKEQNSRTGASFLVNAPAGDLHLQAVSSAVGAADPASTEVDDIDGTGTRPAGCSTDAGADEIAEPGPVAYFTATPITGPAPLNVSFTDQSFSCGTGISTWAWDFDNDTIIDSTLQNPTWVYLCPGSYTVALTVTDNIGTAQTSIAGFVNVVAQTFTMTTSGPGPNQGDLLITPVGTNCGNTAGATQGFTLISLTTTLPVGTGAFAGITFDNLTMIGLIQVIAAGNPLHFPVTGVTYPDGPPFALPPGVLTGLAGFSMDGVEVLLDPAWQVVFVSNVSRAGPF